MAVDRERSDLVNLSSHEQDGESNARRISPILWSCGVRPTLAARAGTCGIHDFSFKLSMFVALRFSPFTENVCGCFKRR